MAALAVPLSSWLVAKRVPRLLAAWVTLLLAAGLVAGIGWLTAVGVADQLDGTEWEEVRTEVRTWLQEGPAGLSDSDVKNLERRAEDLVVGGVTNIDAGRVRIVVELISATFLSVVLFFFFVKDGPLLWGWIIDRIDPRRRAAVDSAGRASFLALTGYMRGVAITGLIDALVIGVALWTIGVPLVIPLALLTFFGAFFPIVGATAAGLLAALVALVANGPGDALLVGLAVLAIQQLEGDLIMPLVMWRQVSLHPTVILLALAAGGSLAGVTGAFVAVPIAAMVAASGRALRSDWDRPRASSRAGDGRTGIASDPDGEGDGNATGRSGPLPLG
jgi:predicted PurR-regulated permease PerM